MIIAVDFDGTCVTASYPAIGEDIGAIPVLSELIRKGHKLVLLTNRSGQELKDAEIWFQAYGIPLFGVNRNPIQWKFSKSPKVFAHLYIDEAALGCPLKTDETLSPEPFADWEEIRRLLVHRKVLSD